MKFLTVSEKKFPKNEKFSNSSQIAKHMLDVCDLDREALWCLHLDTRLNLIDREMVSLGTVSGSIAHPREIFRRAIINGSSAIILVHNHPSGDVSPSIEDHAITQTIKKAGQLLQIELLDHVIICPTGNFYSFADEGAL